MSLRRAEALITAAFLFAYLVLGAVLGEQYPFSALTMFSEGGEVTARIVVRAPDGLHDVTDYAGFRCDALPDLVETDGGDCIGAGRDPERDHFVQDYVTAHPADGATEPITLVRLSHRIETRGGPVVTSECPLAHCDVSRTIGSQ